MSIFSKRSTEKEIMDDLECSGPVLEQTLRELKTINRWLGGNQVTTLGLERLIQQNPQPVYEITDIGCGGGDMIRVMDNWAKRRKIPANFTGIDANGNIIELARVRQLDLSSVQWEVLNVFEPEFTVQKTDIVTCTLFTHHFTDSELVILFKALRQKARLGLVINDLHRHPLAYYSIKWLTRIFSRSPMVQHDAPLSVLRSFSRKDWMRILEKSGFETFQIRWYWAFRWQICVRV
ncbi:MAG: methyltransferase domain-containing protein [Algoriphagus aquaeductus]|jgi:2-polyprenyl-3-methyl-5-hydroxy-6-metoxy-1,4-benzoquinol methylase|uniref:methyltransferase domain-containing protein n=1 Tax=Algoriphagus aquaeductus TaxID=475299 RepID=UPI0039194D7E